MVNADIALRLRLKTRKDAVIQGLGSVQGLEIDGDSVK